MTDAYRAELKQRLYWLISFRVAFAALILVGRAVLVATSFESELITESAVVVVAVGLTSLVSVVLLVKGVVHRGLAYAQLIPDFVVASTLVWWTGGANSPFALLFCVVLISAAPVLGRRATLTFAAVAAVSMVATAVLAAMRADGGRIVWYFNAENSLPHFVSTLLTQVFAFVAVAYLASSLSAESQRMAQALSVAEGALARSADFFERVLMSMNGGVVTLDREGLVAFANPAAERLLGRIQLGETFAHSSADFARILEEQDDRGEGTVHGPMGARAVGYSWVALRDEAGNVNGRTILFRDLTLARDAQRNERLAAVGRLAAGIAHEVRNPLGALSGAIELISQSEAVQKNDRALLDICTREISRLSKLVSDFLEFARPAPSEFARLDLLAIARDTVSLLRNDSRFASRRLEVSGPSVMVEMDGAQMRQVILNLVKNALEAVGDEGSVTVSIGLDAEDRAEIVVRDDGPGVQDEQLGRLFEPFFTTKPQGTGLGLAMVAQLVRQHDGVIAVKNREPHGLQFTITLPKQRLS